MTEEGKKILAEIKEKDIKKYGPVCNWEHCGYHEAFCPYQICPREEAEREKRMKVIAQNGNTGEHYEEETKMDPDIS